MPLQMPLLPDVGVLLGTLMGSALPVFATMLSGLVGVLGGAGQYLQLPILHILGEHSGPLTIWSWFPDPFVIGTAVAISWWYLRAIGPQRETYPGSEPVETWRIVCFFAMLATVIIALLSPLEPLSDDYLLSAHMIQHLMLTIAFPILLIISIPRWLYMPMTTWRGGVPWRVWTFITRPLLAFVLFQLPFAVSHVPFWYELTLRQPQVHVAEHWVYMFCALVGWWAVYAPGRDMGRLQPLLAVLFLFVSTLPGQVVGALITYADGPLYPTYAAASRVWGISVKVDQQVAGLIMWIGTSIIYLSALAIIFFRWAADENRKETGAYAVHQRRTVPATAGTPPPAPPASEAARDE